MVWSIRGGNPAGRVALPGSDLLLTQAPAEPAGSPPAAKPTPAARTAKLRLGGHPVTAVPLRPPDSKGQTVYEVQWRGVTVQAPLTGQLSAAQFKPGSWLKGALERAFRESQSGAACPASSAPVMGSNGRAAHPQSQGLRVSFSDGSGSTTTVRLPLYKDDNGNLGGYFTMVGGQRVPLQGWSPGAAQGHAGQVIESLWAQGRIDASHASTRRTHERVMGGDGAQHWVPLARQSARDGHNLFWAYNAAGLPTETVPKGDTAAFARGWNEARRDRGLLTGMAVANAALGVLGAGAGAGRASRQPARGAGPVGGPEAAWGARTQAVPTGRIEVSNGGRLLPALKQPARPAARSSGPVALPAAPAAPTPLPPRGGTAGNVIDVQAVTVSTQPVQRPAQPARPKPLPSVEVRRQPEAPPPRNQAVVRQAAEWPEAPAAPRAGGTGDSRRPQPPALAQARPAPPAPAGLDVAGAAPQRTPPALTTAPRTGTAGGAPVVQRQRVQQPNQGPAERRPDPLPSASHGQGPSASAVDLSTLRGVSELPPPRPSEFALNAIPPAAVMKAIDVLEANAYPVSGPGFSRAAEPVFGNLFGALNALGSRRLTMAELQGLLDSKLHDPGVILRSTDDIEVAFDPAKRLASPHEFHLFFGGFRGHTGPPLEAPLAGWGGENGLFARVTDEFDDETPSNWGDRKEIFKLWSIKVLRLRDKMFGEVPESFWAGLRDDLTNSVDEGLHAELKALRSRVRFGDPRFREQYRPLIEQLKTTPPGSPERREAAARLVDGFRSLDAMLREGVPLSGATAEVQLLETLQAYLKTQGMLGRAWRPDDSIDFVEMYRLYVQLHDEDKLTTREQVRSTIESMGLRVSE